MKTLIAMAAAAGTVSAANAQLGVAVEPGDNKNFLSETFNVAPGYDGNGMPDAWSPGDMFGITSTTTAGSSGVPFSMLDESVAGFPGDDQGIISEFDAGDFFGVVDTVNGSNPNDGGSAEWTFDITGATGLSVNADFAAQGDFEDPGDFFNFTYSIDGGAAQPLFTSSIDEDGSQTYTMDDGTVVSEDDPLLINGVLLSNEFQNISSAISGTGSTLTISFSAEANGGSEAFAFRSLTVVPTPGAAALAGIAGVAGLRRRRA